MRRKSRSNILGLGVCAAGISILLACFMPPTVLVCIEAVLLIAAGIIWFLTCR